MDVAGIGAGLVVSGRFGPEHASEDAALVRRAGAGDGVAFARLYERYVRMVHGLLLARVGRGVTPPPLAAGLRRSRGTAPQIFTAGRPAPRSFPII
jgi:hypothetical protein